MGRCRRQLPIAIAVDAGTWSASEIFAFGLRQQDRATIVGERTPGYVGSVEAAALSGDARVGVNVMKVTGPNGEMYNGVGVKPDIVTKSTDAVDSVAFLARAGGVGPDLRSPAPWAWAGLLVRWGDG